MLARSDLHPGAGSRVDPVEPARRAQALHDPPGDPVEGRVRDPAGRLRRAPENGQVDEEITIRELQIRPASRTASLGDQPLELTPVEYELLESLARARGRVKSREHLVDEIAHREFDVFDRSVDVHVSALRKKLGDNAKSPRFIRTVRAVGYMMIDPAREP